MKKNLFLAGVISLFVLFLSGSVWAQVSERTFASEAITVTSTEVKSLTSATYTVDAKKAKITFEGADVRYTVDGSSPSSTAGHLLSPNASPNPVVLWLGPYELRGFRVISTTATWNATLQVSYFK